MTDHLELHLGEHRVGSVRRLRREAYRLDYDENWMRSPHAVPVSLSLPLAPRVHTGDRLRDYLDNLLPDDPAVRERWATQVGLGDSEPFPLLAHYGQDVAGAVCLHAEGDPTVSTRVELDSDDIARRIRTARHDAGAWHDELRPPDGQFSLGGAQTKFSLTRHEGRWFETTGSDASTHIVKPAVRGVPDGEIVEFLTMRAAAVLGIEAAQVELTEFGEEHALMVERFDRSRASDPASRVHQEDLVQALGIARLRKYERDGGPSIDAITDCLSAHGDVHAAESKRRFARVLAFSWIMLNTDAHAKNHSVFLSAEGARLTPLYDASSVIPYLGPSGLDRESLLNRAGGSTLAMRYGASFRAGDIGGFELGAIARRSGMPARELVEQTALFCAELPAVLDELAASLPERFRTELVERFVAWMPVRAEQAFESLRTAL